MKYYFNIVLLNKKRWIPFFICLVLPFLYIIRSYFDDPSGIMTLNKNLLLFQNDGIPSGYQYLIPYMWYMAIYILMLIGDFGIDMKKKGYNDIIITKNLISKTKKNQNIAMFLIPFLLVFITLGVNFVVTFLFLGSYDTINMFDVTNKYSHMLVTYPIIFSIFSILCTATINGFLGITAHNLTKICTQKKQVYLALFLFWYILIMMPEAITMCNLTQIFSNTRVDYIWQSIIFLISYFVMVNMFILIIYKKKEENEKI